MGRSAWLSQLWTRLSQESAWQAMKTQVRSLQESQGAEDGAPSAVASYRSYGLKIQDSGFRRIGWGALVVRCPVWGSVDVGVAGVVSTACNWGFACAGPIRIAGLRVLFLRGVWVLFSFLSI